MRFFQEKEGDQGASAQSQDLSAFFAPTVSGFPQKQAAGILLCRRRGMEFQVLLVHPSGSHSRNNPWGIPKCGLGPGEAPEDAARGETLVETGILVTGPFTPLDSIRFLKSGKLTCGVSGSGPPSADPRCTVWEIDRDLFLNLAVARKRIHPNQRPFFDRVAEILRKQERRLS